MDRHAARGAIVILAALAASPGQASGLFTPVDLRRPAERQILLDWENTACDVFSHPTRQTGCTTTSASPGAVFGTSLIATLRLADGIATVTIDSDRWDRFLGSTTHDPGRGITYGFGSASQFVLRIDPATGVPLSYDWRARLRVDGATGDVLQALLVEGPGGEAYGGLLDPPGLPAALACGLNRHEPPDAAECRGGHFVANEAYDPAHGTLHHAAVISGPGDLLYWWPVDVRLREIPEPRAGLLVLLLSVAIVRRRRNPASRIPLP